MSDVTSRQRLLAAAAREQAQLEVALNDLQRAVTPPFAIGRRLREHMAAHPVGWLTAALVIGVWVGRRRP